MKNFNEKELYELYNSKINLKEDYFKKYENVPNCPLRSWNYSWNSRDFPRVWCVLDFKEWVEKHNIKTPDLLGYTCESDVELEFLEPKNKILLSYPPFDLHTSSIQPKESFDFFLFNQTIEHLYNPFKAIENIYDMIKPGGVVFTSVPTLNIPHMTPIHFGGYNPMGLATMFVSAGFEVLEIGQWGNYDYIQQLWKTHEWPDYNALQKNNFVSNEPRNVCQCWILARKPK